MENSTCPQCESAIPQDAPMGLCPKCLLNQPLEDALNSTAAATKIGKFVAPSVDELSEKFPNFEVVSLIGQGGMGAVYKARQKTLQRDIALKVLPPELGKDAAFAERFTREARSMARLNHPNIVTIYEFGEIEGQFFLVMEFVNGVNLREAIASKTINSEQALAIVPQICEALQYAHEEGIVHRDIKPENILIDERGRVKIADFGLAKLLGRSPMDVTLTATHQVMGTLHYMAPEQMERPLEVDHRADIFSLGVVFYELLTGELPLGRFKLPSESKSIDSRLDEVVLKSLERKPDERYQLASDLRTDVEQISSSQNLPPIVNEPSSPIAKTEILSRPNAATIPPVVNSANRSNNAAIPRANIDSFEQPKTGVLGLVGNLMIVVGILIFLSPLAIFFWLSSEQGVGIMEVAILVILSIPLGIIAACGGLAISRRTSQSVAITGAVCMLIPSGLVWLISLPLGIWALVLLTRKSAEQHFSSLQNRDFQTEYGADAIQQKPVAGGAQSLSVDPSTVELTRKAKKALTAPAVSLSCIGWFNLFSFSLICLAAILLTPMNMRQEHGAVLPVIETQRVAVALASQSFAQDASAFESRGDFASPRQVPSAALVMVIPILLVLSSIFVGLIQIFAGRSMVKLNSYGFCVFGSVLSLLPISVMFLFSFPVAIWLIITLMSTKVKMGFEANE